MSRLGRRFDRVKAVAAQLFSVAGQIALFAVIAILGGIGTSWYLTSSPSALTVERNGPWVRWVNSGRHDADPYTRARFKSVGMLPLDAHVAPTWEARTDSDGQRLHSSCVYNIEGKPPAGWWSIAVFTEDGKLIANSADRHAYNASTVAFNVDGSFAVVLAREVRSGNWLPTTGAGRLAVHLTIIGGQRQQLFGDDAGPPMPTIRRIGCR
jgi:hypothetical protein